MLLSQLCRARAFAQTAAISGSRSARTLGARHSSSSKALNAAVQDPSSPVRRPSGTQSHLPQDVYDQSVFEALGILTPEPTHVTQLREKLDGRKTADAEFARAELLKMGFDELSFWEQPVMWGDQDMFQHVNNVRYVRWFECSRMKWIESLGYELGGNSKALDMCQGRGVSLILKSHAVKYIRPVTFPDTVLVAHKPYDDYIARPSAPSGPGQKNPLTQIPMKAVIWSYTMRRVVTESDSVLVWYDYDRLAKCVPGEDMLSILSRRAKIGAQGD